MKWFEITLVTLTLFSGCVVLLDKLFLAKRRAERGGLLDNEEPLVVDYSRAFFPVLLVVLVLRSFIAEPYKIPSSSMMPNLLVGDFLLVNKFAYGIRLPITNTVVIPTGEPKRGDVVVFQYPGNPRLVNDPSLGENFIKRVVGLPGDRISFHCDTLFINGQPLNYETRGKYAGTGPGTEKSTGAALLSEDLPGRTHTILDHQECSRLLNGDWGPVPPGHYFMMGDNRDDSDDSRDWGLVPEQNLRGKAFVIWLNCYGWFCKDGFKPSRIGSGIQ